MTQTADATDVVEVITGDLDAATGTDHDTGPEYTERPMIPVALLTAHPGNVREDKQASPKFCRSVAAAGILTPLEIAIDREGGYRVVDGNVRLDAALKVGLEAVPYFFTAEASANEALQYLHMVLTAEHRMGLSPQEVGNALFAASELGMTRTDIRNATGMPAPEVKAGVRAGGLSDLAKETAAGMDYEWTLDELALLEPFQDDPDALETIRQGSRYSPLRYTVQRLLDDRAARDRRATLLAELAKAGVTVTEEQPEGAVPLNLLLNGDQEMDADAHADCPGRGASVGAWRDAPPEFYCLDPATYGHVFMETGTTSPPEPVITATAPVPGKDATASQDRKLVIEGNKAWIAAGTVRQQWLAEFLARKTPPRNDAALIARFVTEQLATMPEPLCRALGGARFSRDFERFGAPTAESVAISSLPGLWMIALTPIVTAYEHEITGEGERRNTWRADRYSPCERDNAGAYLRFILALGTKHGYEPSPIERAVADGVPYRGAPQPTRSPTPFPRTPILAPTTGTHAKSNRTNQWNTRPRTTPIRYLTTRRQHGTGTPIQTPKSSFPVRQSTVIPTTPRR